MFIAFLLGITAKCGGSVSDKIVSQAFVKSEYTKKVFISMIRNIDMEKIFFNKAV